MVASGVVWSCGPQLHFSWIYLLTDCGIFFFPWSRLFLGISAFWPISPAMNKVLFSWDKQKAQILLPWKSGIILPRSKTSAVVESGHVKLFSPMTVHQPLNEEHVWATKSSSNKRSWQPMVIKEMFSWLSHCLCILWPRLILLFNCFAYCSALHNFT